MYLKWSISILLTFFCKLFFYLITIIISKGHWLFSYLKYLIIIVWIKILILWVLIINMFLILNIFLLRFWLKILISELSLSSLIFNRSNLFLRLYFSYSNKIVSMLLVIFLYLLSFYFFNERMIKFVHFSVRQFKLYILS